MSLYKTIHLHLTYRGYLSANTSQLVSRCRSMKARREGRRVRLPEPDVQAHHHHEANDAAPCRQLTITTANKRVDYNHHP